MSEFIKNIADVGMVGGTLGVFMELLPNVTIVLVFLIALMRLVNEVQTFRANRKEKRNDDTSGEG